MHILIKAHILNVQYNIICKNKNVHYNTMIYLIAVHHNMMHIDVHQNNTFI